MTARGIPDVIGVTAVGRSIITSTGCCTHFERQNSVLGCTQECWYCKYADFRENTVQQKQYGVCRREGGKLFAKLSDDELDEVVGGILASEQIVYKCQCGAVFCCPMVECPICHSTEIQKTQ